MKPITRKQAMTLLAPISINMAQWSIYRVKNGLGDYGIDETYCLKGKPIVMLRISYYPPKCIAFDVR